MNFEGKNILEFRHFSKIKSSNPDFSQDFVAKPLFKIISIYQIFQQNPGISQQWNSAANQTKDFLVLNQLRVLML